MEKEIRDMNVKELKALAKERGIKRYYWLRKAQLIESLETETPPTEAPERLRKLWKHLRLKLWKHLRLKLWKHLRLIIMEALKLWKST